MREPRSRCSVVANFGHAILIAEMGPVTLHLAVVQYNEVYIRTNDDVISAGLAASQSCRNKLRALVETAASN